MFCIRLKLIVFVQLIVVGLINAQLSKSNLINSYNISKNVLVVRTGETYPDKVVAISTLKGVLLIDAGISPTLSGEYKKLINKEFNKEINYVVNTHHHFDHTNGNQVFANTMIIAHKNCGKEMETFSKNITSFVVSREKRYEHRNKIAQSLDTATNLYKRFRDLVFTSKMMCADLKENYRLTKPNLTFNDKLQLDLGDITLILYYFGNGFHSNNDIIAFIPEEGLVFTGDLLQFYETNTNLNSNLNYKHAIKVLDEILNSGFKLKHIVTVHAGLLPPQRLKKYRNNLSNILYCIKNKTNASNILMDIIGKTDKETFSNTFETLTNDTAKYYFLEGDLNLHGDNLLGRKLYNKAISIFQICTKLWPTSPDAYDWLGYAYMCAERNQEAIEAFEKELSINPLSSYAYDMINLLNNSNKKHK